MEGERIDLLSSNVSNNTNNESKQNSETTSTKKTPVVVLVIGMAGSGKTTLMQRINLYLNEQKKKGYYLNLDPAVKQVPFGANIDIRDTVNYKEVMQQYNLGPNGGIITSLNLFATRFDQVLEILERRASDLDYIFIDTPGQIEVFTWSAGGQIIHELLASSFPTIILYVTDTVRSEHPTTFMSNMLYACSVLYKSRLPMVCVFNKIDIISCDFLEDWIHDFEAFQEALDQDKEEYMTSLNRSLSLVLDEFYRTINYIGVSAGTGEGMEGLFYKIEEAVIDYETNYRVDLNKQIEEKKKREEAINKVKMDTDIQRLQQDMKKMNT